MNLLELTEVIADAKRMDPAEQLRLRKLSDDIVHRYGGVSTQDPDLTDPAGGALAEHAFAVLSRELIRKDPAWEQPINNLKREYPHRPPPSR